MVERREESPILPYIADLRSKKTKEKKKDGEPGLVKKESLRKGRE